VWVDDDRAFYNFAPITLGSNVALAHCVDLYTGLHDHTTIDLPIRAESILVEDEVWLTNDFFVGPGVNIGRGAVAAEVRPTRAYHPGWSAMARRPEPVKPRVSA
jgi:putative colanic acid biosynthesis acetyltransferase WcaF